MSKPEHTESPAAKPSSEKSEAGAAASDAGSPAAKPGGEAAAPVSAEPADAASDADPAGSPAGSPAAKPGSEKAAPAAAEPADAAPEAEPVVGKPGLSKAAAEAVEAGPAAGAADAEPADAEPAVAKPGLSKTDGSPAAKPGREKAAAADPADAVPAAAKPGLSKAAGSSAAKPVVAKPGSNPVVEKADAMAAAVKAAAKAAGDGKDEGRLLAGRYRLGAVLGKGGMGTVWRAQDETLGRTVAVKELRFSSGVDEDEKRRLITRTLREAKAIARIRSGGAVTVYDVVDEDARPWIVMELIEGPSLAEFIRENGPLTPHRAAEVGLAVLDVLRAAHGQGILHRDVKPSNVLIAGNGRVVLTDFGIAQVEGDPSVTSTGMLVGAPSYISPERARGHKPGPPADMWSLGGLLYASVEGVPPYDKGSALATLTAVMTEPVEPPKNAGPLIEVIYGLLAKDPAHRLDDSRARAMLSAVLAAPEPEPAPVVAAAAEETRQISLADAKEAADKAAAEKAEKAAEKAAKKERERRDREQRERARAALKAARKAATAAAATTAVTAAEPPKSKPSPVKAPLTDVMQRRTIVLAAAAVVVVLAVVGSLIAYAFSTDDKDPKDESKGGGKPTPAASAPKDPGGGTGNTSPKPSGNTGDTGGNANGSAGTGAGTGGQQSPAANQGQGATSGGGAGGALPAGFVPVQDFGFHFSMAMPEGFKQTGTAGENSGGIYSRDGGFPRIQVDYTDKPGNDARLAWAKAAPAVAGSSTSYRQIRIDAVDYRGYPTVADWEFEREQKGIKVRVLNRGFKLDATHGYAIMISCAADQWDGAECTQMRNVAFETFQPLG
ncbi:serine/threonine-protein kinase [Streptomyces sp. Sge12]|uniref:serine/threonine-protein kinase n=1 Tax=Streptomyces sp. Sge12 TaxID=1972846 RepID=UPI000D1B46AB|nr:serine/threonine-protein kinase [Streptomyces sp. Sge12]